MGRILNAIDVWTQVPLASKKASIIRSIQQIKGSQLLSNGQSNTNINVTLGTTLTDTSKAIILQNAHWSFTGSTNGIGGGTNDGNSYGDRKSTRLNSSHVSESRMPSSA